MDSILTSIKKLLGVDSAYTAFDADIIMCINTAFNILNQLGVGPEGGFSITGSTETWSNYMADMSKMEMIKSYIHQRVRLMWDPPTGNSALIENIKNQIAEYEWRLLVQAENDKEVQ